METFLTINVFFWVLLFSPLAGFFVNAFRFKSRYKVLSACIGSFACLLSFIAALFLFLNYETDVEFTLFSWLSFGTLQLPFSFYMDSLSLLMSLLITGVGSIIHIYSAGYMFKDPGLTRYFAYLNLFVFNMLILVFASHLPLLFIGWEGVGLCSYLLIGFWFKEALKVGAGMKAFLVNRVGDACFLMGIFLAFSQFETLSFQSINFLSAEGGERDFFNQGSLAALFLFLGATAKSAQFPLHVWLADAMAGPTPVSALIHAATMVTAGVYLVLRLFSLYSVSPDVLLLLGWIGALTALGAAFAAAGQRDLKKILAYSTVSQLGYMFMALSAQAFPAAAFHLLTHGFFKALLFLCAGSIIHGLGGEQDIYRMGGLKKYFPKTFPAWLIGALSLVALPPFSGFFSKDEILWSLFIGGSRSLWLIALLTSALTAFYMTRVTILVFFGTKQTNSPLPHESPLVMWLPLAVLSFFSFTLGVLGLPHLFSEILPDRFIHILHSWLDFLNIKAFSGSHLVEAGLMILSTGLVLSVIGFTAYYFLKAKKPGSLPILEKAFYVDDLLQFMVVRPLKNLSIALNKYIEGIFIQEGILFLIRQIQFLGRIFSTWQNGSLHHFIFYFVIGLSFLLALLFI